MANLPEITLSGGLMLGNIDELVERLRPLTLPEPPACVLNLKDVTFVGPTSLALLVAAFRHAGPGAIARVVYPNQGGVRAYMERMDVFDLLPADTEAWEGGRRTPQGFRECRRFVTQSDCVETSNELAGAVSESCAMSPTSLRALKSCIAELAENVVFHAETGDGGYAAAQTWPRRKRLEVGIVDLGRGIRRSLAENPKYAAIDSDVAAIRSAVQLGVTATPERNTGQGLFSTARLLEFNGGSVLVRSGCGYVYDGSRKESGDALFLPGTLVALTINTSRPLDDGAVARLIGDLKGGDEDLDDLFE